ncbi:hypothetical protein Tco_0452994 [Tanacetum coccineum]
MWSWVGVPRMTPTYGGFRRIPVVYVVVRGDAGLEDGGKDDDDEDGGGYDGGGEDTVFPRLPDAFCQKYHIPDSVHPELPGLNQNIHNSPDGKIGVYTRFFDFANFWVPLSRFLVDVLEYFRINLSQLSVIAAAKISHFEILCRVYEMDLFAFIHHADPTKMRIGERQIEEGRVPLLDSTMDCVIPLASEDDQARSVVRVGHGDQNDNIENVGHDDPNEESGVADQEYRSEGNDDVGQDKMATILVDAEVQVAAADKPKGKRKKRRAIGGASGSNHPPKKLREDYGTSGNVSASTDEKSLAAIKGLYERSTLNVEVGVTAAATMPFITSSVTLMAEHEEGGDTDSISGLSFVPPPPVMTAAVTATVTVGASFALVLGAGAELAT